MCTSALAKECQQQASSYHILPPIISAKLTTSNLFSFLHGVIEIRAKFPEGDWLHPEMWLEPLYKTYDNPNANARINLGRVRGNEVLGKIGDSREDYSSKLVEFGVGNGTGSDFHEEIVSKARRSGGSWNKEFHIYKTTWSKGGFAFHVDGQLVGKLVPTQNGWATSTSDEAIDEAMMAPFDEKFYLSIGLAVGGVRVFPDGTQTNTYVKPWKNTNAKAMLYFWQAKSWWIPSWQVNNGAKTALEVDYIRIWSLD